MNEKALQRARDVVAAGASLPARIALFNMHVGSLYMFRGRFSVPGRRALEGFRRASQIVTAAPWMSYPPAVLEGMSGLGFRTDLVDLESRLWAARYATIAQSDTLRATWRWIDASIASDEAVLAAVGDRGADFGWRAGNSIVVALRREHADCEAALLAGGGVGTQRAFLQQLRRTPAERHGDTQATLLRRARRWNAACPEAVVGAYLISSPIVLPPRPPN